MVLHFSLFVVTNAVLAVILKDCMTRIHKNLVQFSTGDYEGTFWIFKVEQSPIETNRSVKSTILC